MFRRAHYERNKTIPRRSTQLKEAARRNVKENKNKSKAICRICFGGKEDENELGRLISRAYVRVPCVTYTNTVFISGGTHRQTRNRFINASMQVQIFVSSYSTASVQNLSCRTHFALFGVIIVVLLASYTCSVSCCTHISTRLRVILPSI